MEYDIYGRAVTAQETPEAMQSKLALNKMKAAQDRARQLAAKYNRNPKSMSDEEVLEAKGMAESFGYKTTIGQKKDKAGVGDAAKGLIWGAIDSALLGLIKNEWYTNRRNGDYAKAGRIAGLVTSIAAGGFMNPASISKVSTSMGTVFGASKTGKLISSAMKAGAKYGTTAGVTRGIKNAAIAKIAGTATSTNWKRAALKLLGNQGTRNALKVAKGIGKAAPYAALGTGGLITLGNIGQSYEDVVYGDDYEDLEAQGGMLPQIPQQ